MTSGSVVEEKKYKVTCLGLSDYWCDTAAEVGNYIKENMANFANIRVFDSGVEMFSKQYIEYQVSYFPR